MFNVGQFRATICGLKHAKGKYVVTMDDDLQHPPEEIGKLYARLRDDQALDAVMGIYQEKRHSLIRRFGSSLLAFVNNRVFRQVPGVRTSSFRCLRRAFVETVLANQTHYPVIGPLILSSTHRLSNVTVRHDMRQNGDSSYSLFRLISSTLDNILSFSSLPLQLISLIGICVSFLSFGIGLVYLFLHLFRRGGVIGWTSLFLSINFYGGLILLSIGLIGEYLIRIFNESKRQPLYVVRTTIGYEKGQQQT
jgi:polyisoprenyl-phosphate glycosyltransferase